MNRLRNATQGLRPKRSHLTADLIAALTFAVVNVPQAMGHALLAAVNPLLGIYTLMVSVPVGAIFSSSVFMNVSTTGALSLAAGAVLIDFPPGQRAEGLVVLVLMVGVFQLLAGLFRLGFVIRFVSNAVMTGFLNGIAVLIVLGQLSDLTGYQSSFSNRVAQALDLLLHLGQINPQASTIGLLTLGLIALLLWLKATRRFAFIIAIAAATIALVVLNLPALSAYASFASFATVPTVGTLSAIPRELPQLALPQLSLVLSLWLPALSIAIIGLVQGAGVSQGTPNPDGRYPTCRATSSAKARPTWPPAWSAACRRAVRSPARCCSWARAPGRAGPTFSSGCSWRSSCCWPGRWWSGCPCPHWPRC